MLIANRQLENIAYSNSGLQTSSRISYTDGIVSKKKPNAGCSNIDWQDIQNCLNGDSGSYQRIVQRYQDSIGRYMWRFTRSETDREILVQDVFVEAYYSLKTFKGNSGFSSWLKTIATRVGYKFWKQQKRHRHKPLPEDSASDILSVTSTDIESREAAQLVHALLAKLPPRDRLVLTLTYLEEQSMSEVAKNTGWSYSMVKVQAHRARKKLKNLLEKQG